MSHDIARNGSVMFDRPLVAAVHKGQSSALVADCIARAASCYAMNAGAANNIEAVRTACLTTEKAKARTPAAGTLAALILGAMDAIKAGAEKAGARSKGKDEKRTPSERQALADAYAAERRQAFVLDVEAAAAARKEKADKRAAEKGAAAPVAGATSEGADAATPKGAAQVNPAELDALVALQALNTLSDSDLFALAAKHEGLARRVAACFALPLSAAGAAAGAVVNKAKAPRKPAKPAPVAADADAAALWAAKDAKDAAEGLAPIGTADRAVQTARMEAGAMGAMAHALVAAGAAHADAVHAA
jgi:hypothetical protein